MINETFTAFQREAALTAEEMCNGVTLVPKANYARQGRYLQMFFSLSIAFERASKLVIIIDHIIETGQKPDETIYRQYRHNIKGLLGRVEEISDKLHIDDFAKMPKTQIHNDIISILSDFANNVTRYYNLDIISQTSKPKGDEPISQWFQKVTLPLYEKHVTKKKKESIFIEAPKTDVINKNFALVYYTSETGENIDNMYDASSRIGMLKVTEPYTRLYVLQICRFLAAVLSEQERYAMSKRAGDVPYMSDFFRVFYNEDSYFKSRKTWEIV